MDRWMEITDSSCECLKPQLPPGFRFHPTDEELVVHYLKKKAAAAPLPVSIIAEVDIYKFDPWELPAKAIFGEQEWYFFSPRDRKYPNGARPNRAATSGYWKATGTDKPVMTAQGTHRVGVKKALVFYVGKPPKGVKTNWIMHEYRLHHNKVASMKPFGCDGGNKKGSLRLDDWVLCRIYKKSDAQIIRHIDRERDDTNRAIGSIHPTILMPDGQHKLQGFKAFSYGSLLENDDDKLYQGMMMRNDSIIGQETPQPPLMVDDPNLLASKRMLPSLYWNDDEGNAKRFLAEGCEGRADVTTNNIATILSQLPHGTSLQHQAMVGTLGDGVFRQAQPYQVSAGMNWYS